MRKFIFLLCVIAIHKASAQKFVPALAGNKGYIFVDPVTMQPHPKLANLGPVNLSNRFSFRDGMLMIEKKDEQQLTKYGFISASGDTLINPVYEEVSEFSEGFACVKFNGKRQFIDRQGNLLKLASTVSTGIKNLFSKSYFYDGFAVVEDINGKKGYIDKSGNLVISYQFENADGFKEGFAAVKQNGKWGYIDKTGKIVVRPNYDYAADAENGHMYVAKNSKWGVIDKTGKEIVRPEYDVVMDCGKNFLFKYDSKWICVDPSGNEIFSKNYNEVQDFSEGLAAVSINKKWGFIDTLGKEIIPPRYDSVIGGFEVGVDFVQQAGKWSLIDKAGKALGNLKFSAVGEGVFYENLDGLFGIEMNGKWGYIDKNGKLIIPCIYEDVQNFNDGMAVVNLKGKYGYINKTGKLVIPAKFYYARYFNNGIAEVSLTENDEFASYINKTGKEYRQKSTAPTTANNQVLVPFLKGGKIVLADSSTMQVKDGHEFVVSAYSFESLFSKDLIKIGYDGLGFGFVNKRGKMVGLREDFYNKQQYRGIYDEAEGFQEGYACVRLGLSWSFIDSSGKEVFPQTRYTFSKAKSFNEGLAAVKTKAWGFINKKGQTVIPCKYDTVFSFHEGLAVVMLGNKWGYIDKSGKVIVPPQYEKVYDFKEGLALVSSNSKYGFLDKTGKLIVPLQFNNATEFENGVAAVNQNNKWGVIDKTGKVIIPIVYDNMGYFSEDLLAVYGGKWGYINKTGETVIPFKFDKAGSFREGLAPVQMGFPWGFINKQSDLVIQPKYFYASSFYEGLSAVRSRSGEYYGYIDKTGKEVIPLKYSIAGDFKNGFAIVQLRDPVSGNSEAFFIDKAGREYRQK